MPCTELLFDSSHICAMRTSVLAITHTHRRALFLSETRWCTFPQVPYQIHLLSHSCVAMHNRQTLCCNNKSAGIEDNTGIWQFKPKSSLVLETECQVLVAGVHYMKHLGHIFPVPLQRKPFTKLQYCSWYKPNNSQWGKCSKPLNSNVDIDMLCETTLQLQQKGYSKSRWDGLSQTRTGYSAQIDQEGGLAPEHAAE